MAMHQNSPQSGFNSQQFQNQQYSAFNGGMQGGVEHKDIYVAGNQHNVQTTKQPGYPFANLQISNPQDLMQVKTSALLLQMQRIQQQIQQMQEMGQPAQMQQLQFQFQRLYQIYLVQQQQRVQPNFQPQNYDQLRFLQQQRQQEKANRIAVEAMAKAALHNADGLPPMPGFPPMSSSQRMMGNPSGVNTGMAELSRHPKPGDPINLGPSIVSKPAPVRSSHTLRCFCNLCICFLFPIFVLYQHCNLLFDFLNTCHIFKHRKINVLCILTKCAKSVVPLVLECNCLKAEIITWL